MTSVCCGRTGFRRRCCRLRGEECMHPTTKLESWVEDVRSRQRYTRRSTILAATALPIALRNRIARAAAPASIRVGYFPGFSGVLPVLLAEDLGLYKSNGLTADLQANSQPIQPLISGDTDVVLPAPAVAALATTQGL